MAHDARNVANKLVRIALDDKREITPMQVLKLTYFCHAWMLGLYHKSLMKQPVEAWRYGPVVPDVYFMFRQYGGNPIEKPADLASLGIEEQSFDDCEEDVIAQVSAKYGHLTGAQMSSLAHETGSPWFEVWTNWGKNAFIPDPMIETYYTRKANGENLAG